MRLSSKNNPIHHTQKLKARMGQLIEHLREDVGKNPPRGVGQRVISWPSIEPSAFQQLQALKNSSFLAVVFTGSTVII